MLVRKFYSTQYIVFLFVLAIGFALPFAFKKSSKHELVSNRNDLFNEKLLAFNSVSKTLHFLDYTNQVKKNTSFDTIAYVNSASDFIKQRFSFGLASYSYSDNWIATVCSDLFWEHFSAIVNPNDILKHDVGICSQQTIVFLEILRQKKINVRSVGLGNQIKGPGHFICEVNYNGTWHIYDVTKEPNWVDIADKHFSMDYYLKHQDLFYKIYKNKIDEENIKLYLTEVSYGSPNEFPAKNMLLFHKITYLLTIFIPMFLVILGVMVFYKGKKIRN